MFSAVILAMFIPAWSWPDYRWHYDAFPYLMAVWCIGVAVPVGAAIRDPTPTQVQRAVKWLILGLIGLDAVLAFLVVGWPGLLILLLLIPAILLGRWLYST
jgi:4-hydroxybenzoate polyprenyltransferase